MRLADVPARHRVALVGDSFTFGLEVRYADTWGHRLDEALGPEVQVLNFGVDAYGVDQAYLRYRRDAASWQPDVVVLGVIDEDFRRSLGVYAFLGFPAWDIPFPKPRFTVTDGRLEPLNLPLPQPRSIFEADSVLDLPYVGHDVAFDAEEWRRRPLDRSYLVRFLLSRFPRWSAPSPSVSSEALATVNRELLRSFVASVARDGAVPLIVFFPTMAELADEEGTGNGPARTILRSADIPYLDMTDCVRQVPPSDRFVILHYSPESNAAVAECLSGAVRERLADR